MIEGTGGKVKVCLDWAHLLSPVGSGKPKSKTKRRLERRENLLVFRENVD